jgi:hypothetical protein
LDKPSWLEVEALSFEDITLNPTATDSNAAGKFGGRWQVSHCKPHLEEFIPRLSQENQAGTGVPSTSTPEPVRKQPDLEQSLALISIDEILKRTPPVKRESADDRRLDKQIQVHRQACDGGSFLDNAIDAAIGVVFRKDQEGLLSLEETRAKICRAQTAGNLLVLDQLLRSEDRLVSDRRQALAQKAEIHQYADSFVKSAALFLKGRLALSSAALIYGLDEAKPSGLLPEQAKDLFWGVLKGGCLQTTFEKLGGLSMGVAARGTTLGVASRAVEIGLSSQTVNRSSDINQWLGKVFAESVSRDLIASDLATFTVAHGLFGTLNKVSAGKIEASPLLARVFTGSTFGISTGAAGEIERERSAGQPLNLQEIAKRSLIQGALDGLAAGAGGVQADPRVRSSLREGVQVIGEPLQSKVSAHLAGEKLPGCVLDRLEKLADDALEVLSPRRPSSDLVSLERVWKSEMFDTLTARLKGYKAETQVFDIPVEGVFGPFKDWSDFRNRALTTEKRPVRVYEVEGHSAQIIVPEEYAVQLDRVRDLYKRAFCANPALSAQESLVDRSRAKLALLADPMNRRLLPERLIHFLDELPDRTLVKKIYLLNEPDPDLQWFRSTYRPDFNAAADANPSGVIRFFFGDDGPAFRSILHHEWAHLLRFDSPSKGTYWFDQACKLEEDGFFVREYARKDNHENWAVHTGEELMALDLGRFYATARRAPLRSAVWARTIASQLSYLSQGQRSVFDDKIVQRIEYLEREIVPKARRVLARISKNGDILEAKAASDLLKFLEDDK